MNTELVAICKDIDGNYNIEAVENFVQQSLQGYRPELFKDADAAKKGRAELNKSRDFLKEKRRELLERVMAPYRDFEARFKKLEHDIDDASAELDAIVKDKENSEKDEKRKTIELLWNERGFKYFPLDKIFEQKWLNKTFPIEKVLQEINRKIIIFHSGLKEIEDLNYSDDAKEKIKAIYINCFSVSDAIDLFKKMEYNQTQVRAEASERTENEKTEKLETQAKELAEDVKAFSEQNTVRSLVTEITGEEPEPKEYVISVRVTEAELLSVKNYLTAQKIVFQCEKLDF